MGVRIVLTVFLWVLDVPRQNPFLAAEKKGREAFLAGRSEMDCPYLDKRKADGRLTFGRAWRLAWLTGYRAARKAAMFEGLTQ